MSRSVSMQKRSWPISRHFDLRLYAEHSKQYHINILPNTELSLNDQKVRTLIALNKHYHTYVLLHNFNLDGVSRASSHSPCAYSLRGRPYKG